MERDTIITSEEDVVLNENEFEEQETKEIQSQIPLSPGEQEIAEDDEIEVPLPEIEVDEWIDIEDRWEKDYCFVVFTEEELYQYLYALYYPVLKDERMAQKMALSQRRVLHDVLTRLQKQVSVLPPLNIIPRFNGVRSDMKASLGAYLQQYRGSVKKPYQMSQKILNNIYHSCFDVNKEEPFFNTDKRIEFQIIMDLLPSDSQDKTSKKTKKKGKGKTRVQKEEDQDVSSEQLKSSIDTYVVLEKEDIPLPINGVYKKPFYDEKYINTLYLHERVSWKDATIQDSEYIPRDEPNSPKEKNTNDTNVKVPVNQTKLLSTLRKISKYPYETVLESIDKLPSYHELAVILSKYGYDISSLSLDKIQLLEEHLKKLVSNDKKNTYTTTRRFSWTYKPITHILPSEFSAWSLLKEWIEVSFKEYQNNKGDYEDQLKTLESHTQLFTKNPSIPLDIYDIAMGIKDNKIDLEEVIQHLQSVYREAQITDYTDFLKTLLVGTWDEEIGNIEKKQKDYQRMDDSIIPEKKPILTLYDYTQEILKGARPYMLEDLRMEEVIEQDGEIDRIEELPIDDIDAEETIPILPFEEESSTALVQLLPAKITHGQKEICMYVIKILTVLQKTLELPLNIVSCITALLKTIDRKSQYESLCEKIPEIPAEEIKAVFEQQTTYLAIADAELEQRFLQSYKEVVKEYKKAVIEAIFYSLTWWVIVLQESYIQNPTSLQPGFLPCMPVWAFYGTPMSSSDEKGIARYIVCAIDYLRKQDEDSAIWKLLDSYSEQQLVDKIYKMSKHEDFANQVAVLKQEWKDRWKEVARKEKEMDIRLETLEKSTHTPQEYVSLYVDLIKRLPTILIQKQFEKRETVVVPLANSCCLQPLDSKFQPYSDIKETPLYEKRSFFFSKPQRREKLALRLGTVVVPEKQSVDVNPYAYECTFDVDKDKIKEIEAKDILGITIDSWNSVCNKINKPDWKLPILETKTKDTGEVEKILISNLSSSHIQRAIRDLTFLIEKQVSNGKKQIDIWKGFIEQQTWEKKLLIARTFMQYYYKEKTQYRNLEWIEAVSERCITRMKDILNEISDWRLSDITRDGATYLLDYILLLAIIMPSVPSSDSSTLSLRWEGYDLESIDQKWMQQILDSRMTQITQSLKIQNTPSNQQIQDYYATMRERLKETNLSEYKSKSIEEIQEIQEAKRLKLNKIAEEVYQKMSTREGITEDGTLRPGQTDMEVEWDGENEFRRPAENPDDTREDQIDE